ncbi:MAG TPA: mobile mystery protein B [Rhizomicrobium sp.]|nr:mobile mystery protein B [Rhizomicrobium sp.]
MDADHWAFGRKRNVLNEPFLRGLHRRMFNHVWRWAGKYRASEKNLGVPIHRIQPELHQALDDARYWRANGTYSPDEQAVRVHHRLVYIHPFPNGNGRWSRLAADLSAVEQGGRRFTWGSANLQSASGLRRAYIEALRAADNHDISRLVAFARS